MLRMWYATHERWGDVSWHLARTKKEARKQADDYTRRNPAQGKVIKLELANDGFRYVNGVEQKH